MKSINHLIGELLKAKSQGVVLHVMIDENHSEHNPHVTVIFRHGVLNDVVRKKLIEHITNTYEGARAESSRDATSMFFIYYTPHIYKMAV